MSKAIKKEVTTNQKFSSVWDALEDDPVVRENLKLRSHLLIAIEQTIKERKLTQSEAAKLLETSQPRISSLMQGKIAVFRLDTLVDYATKLGLHIEMKVAA